MISEHPKDKGELTQPDLPSPRIKGKSKVNRIPLAVKREIVKYYLSIENPTQLHVAERFGITQASVSNIIRQHKEGKLDSIKRVTENDLKKLVPLTEEQLLDHYEQEKERELHG